MDGFCDSGPPPKFHNHHSYFNNVPSMSSTQPAPIVNDYALPYSRRFPPSEHGIRPPGGRMCIDRKQESTRGGRICSVALAIASLLVLIAVLSIAGMALYMGALHSDTNSGAINPNILTFSCSVKILKGDRFLSGLQEKSRRYRQQFESLFQRSVLGPGLVSCLVKKFGNDTITVYFKLSLNRKKLNKSVSSIEKAIKDILITDAIARKPIFRNIKFDPKSIHVTPDIAIDQRIYTSSKPIEEKSISTRSGVVLKTRPNATMTMDVKSKKKSGGELGIVKEDSIQGSFKISKTEADITEKKVEHTTLKLTTPSPRNFTTEEPTTFYRFAAIEKVTKILSSTTEPIIVATTARNTAAETTKTTTITTVKGTKTGSPVFVLNPQVFNQEPWIPIVPNLKKPFPNSTPRISISSSTSTQTSLDNREPIYSSFTNPGLSYQASNIENLGTTSLKGHPIPVNKIYETTESLVFTTVTDKLSTESTKDNIESTFVEIETVKYIPGSNKVNDAKAHTALKNISTIFDDLASNLPKSTDENITNPHRTNDDDIVIGEGQVEVVQEDEETFIMQTTKLPLVTLIPVKSNSGIGRPLRRRPGDSEEREINTSLSVENRSFPSSGLSKVINKHKNDPPKPMFEVVTSISSEVNKVKLGKSQLHDFKIVGVLNFATEETSGSEDSSRNPKIMDSIQTLKVYSNTSSTFLNSNSNSKKEKNYNMLTQEQIRQLSEISKVQDNFTVNKEPSGISTKAISSSYTINHSGLKILTKTFNKIHDLPSKTKVDVKISTFNSSNSTQADCETFSAVKCGDGQCLPETTKCNQLIDCNDGKDEQDCKCVDYLRSQFLLKKICDGIVDCWDYSDENQCEWCKPNQYVCGNSKVCIDRSKICDGLRDCPQGDDEGQCVTIATDLKAAEEFPYYPEGYLMVRKFGMWGKLCVQNFPKVVSSSQITWEISDLGKAVCKSMTYQSIDSIKTVVESDSLQFAKYFELSYSFQTSTKSSLSFSETECQTKNVVKVKCQSLECGARPKAIKHIARVVGGGNSGSGSWPWQAALYKEGEFQCGATLLSDQWLVSAGHCFYHSLEEHWVARLGALRRGTALPSPYEQLRPITRVLVHPGYEDVGFINDISLLKMERPVVFSDYVRPICLPKYGQPASDGALCTVIGWGQLFEVGRIFPDTLQEVQVPVISTEECRKRTVFLPLYKITDDMFCGGYERGGRDACLGDSGGPLMCSEPNGRWILHGITSNGYGCARANRPGVYTKVANYVNWIRKSTNKKTDNNRNINSQNSTNPGSTHRKSICLGHRCPLGECLPKSRLCNSYIECSDGSDEKDC